MKKIEERKNISVQTQELVTEIMWRSKSKGSKDRDKNKSEFTNVGCYHFGKKRRIKKYCRQLKKENKIDKGKKKAKGDDSDFDIK